MLVVDADVIIRFLTKDDLTKAKRFKKFLESGKAAAITEVTLAEVYWTLHSFYRYPKQKIIDALQLLIFRPSIRCQKTLMSKALEILNATNISFIDAYTAAYSLTKHQGRILSYDKGFAKVKGVKRLEP